MKNWQDKLDEIKETELVNWLTPVKTWFQELPPQGKLVVGMGGLIVTLSLLSTFLKLISSLFTLGFFALGVFLFYKFFIAPKSGE
jgi:energy-coupling factor transporter transmembrane protein EcfT